MVRGIDGLVGIEDEDPVFGAICKAGVSSGGKVVFPLKRENFGTEAGGDFWGAVGGARVDDDNFVSESLNGGKAPRQVFFLILNNHRYAQGHWSNLYLYAIAEES